MFFCTMLHRICRNFLAIFLIYAQMLANWRLEERQVRTKIGLKAIAAHASIIWDTEIHGFNVRRQFSDVVTYSIVYRTLEGVQRWQRIGRRGVWTPDLDRKQARSVLMARDVGKDPSAEPGGFGLDRCCDHRFRFIAARRAAVFARSRADISPFKAIISSATSWNCSASSRETPRSLTIVGRASIVR
jgi:hypothetical protein